MKYRFSGRDPRTLLDSYGLCAILAWKGTLIILIMLLGACGRQPTFNNYGGDRDSVDGVDFGDREISGNDADTNVGDSHIGGDLFGDTLQGDALPLGDAPVHSSPMCRECHGTEKNAAPPQGLGGTQSTEVMGVGAHQSHLQSSSWHKRVECTACHQVPTAIGDLGHVDSLPPAETTFGVLANSDNAEASFNPQTGDCTNYCHGQTLGGGLNTQPTWTMVDGSQTFCGTCHGLPPPLPHPKNGNCSNCHPTLDATLSFIDPDKHINGVVDVKGDLSCDLCHGSGGDPSPPRDLEGNTSTAFKGVGAHREHLRDSTWRAEVSCDDCHQVPANVGDSAHMDSSPGAELNFGARANAHNATADYDGSTCSNYCHGQTIAGGTNTTPTWTVVDGSQAQCGACHSLPPQSVSHPSNTQCGACHPTIEGDANSAFIEPARHIDGIVDIGNLQCDSCHGSNGDPAPPLDTQGHNLSTARGVGAHREHLAASGWHAQVLCHDCHQVPTTLADAGHTDSPLPAELTFGDKAAADGAIPSWDAPTTTCSNYCHGQTLAGGVHTTPDWTRVDGTEAACGNCHGLPPSAPHVNARTDQCTLCHPTVDAALNIVDPVRHIDGVLNTRGALGCDSCHGSNGNPAPPTDLQGRSSTSLRSVGAHRTHLGVSTWRADITCAACHKVPGNISDPSHIDGTVGVELTWGLLAQQDGASPSFNGSSCTNYCHGQTLAGGSNTTPDWTTVNGTEAVCGSCHSLPPPAPHPANNNCENCHPTMAAGQTITDPSRHIDGIVDVGSMQCDSCHGSGGNPAPPQDTRGYTATTRRGVGAHRAHLAPSDWRAEVQCTACHNVPGDMNDIGHRDSALPAELNFGSRAGASGASPTWNASSTTCSNYCHGQTLSGGLNTTPDWTKVDGTEATCGSCHSLPPSAGHPNTSACYLCHPTIDSGRNFIQAARHIDGILDRKSIHGSGWALPQNHGTSFNASGPAACSTCHGANLDGGIAAVSCNKCHSGWKTNCTMCHGGIDNATGAPPSGVDGETSAYVPQVGGHTGHIESQIADSARACTLCHVVPSSALSGGHIDGDGVAELNFSGLASGGNYTGGNCTNYCHGNGQQNGSQNWTSPWGSANRCDNCHGDEVSGRNTLSGPHKDHIGKGLRCYECHPDVVNSSKVIIDSALHIDGAPDVRIRRGGTLNLSGNITCTPSCHMHGTRTWYGG